MNLPLDFEIPPGAKVLAIPRDIIPGAKGLRYPPGMTVVQFSVRARAVPWKVSIVRKGKGPPTNPKFSQWQGYVRSAARVAMGAALPHSGPYEIHASFDLVARGTMPDRGNLMKGTEDALQGVVILNDRLGRAEHTTYNPEAECNLVIVRVVAL